MDIIVTPSAEKDIRDIFNYISQDNPKKALDMINIFEKQFDLIGLFPFRGVSREVSGKEIRICVTGKHYLIVYRIKTETVFVLRVLTGYSDITDELS